MVTAKTTEQLESEISTYLKLNTVLTNPYPHAKEIVKRIESYHDSLQQPGGEAYVPPTGKNKPFIVANVREIIEKEFDETGIVSSRMVEMFNEVADKYYSEKAYVPKECWVWVKASERLPDKPTIKTIFRQASTATVLSFNMAKDWIEDKYLHDLEWLSPSPLPSPPVNKINSL